MRVMAIDPGPIKSAYVDYEDGRVHSFGKFSNDTISLLSSNHLSNMRVVIEMIASYGMPVGAEVFETCIWIGRFIEGCVPDRWSLVYRKDVKLHLCNSPRANDATIRQALIDRFGGKAKAIGNKKQPGPLYGVSGDVWQALALAVTFAETHKEAA